MIQQTIELPPIIATFISMIPLIIYIAFFDKKDKGYWLGPLGRLIIKNLRRIKWRTY